MRDVRHFVIDVAAECPVRIDVDVATLVASELATNAVLHARSAFAVGITISTDSVRIEVSDDNPRMPMVAAGDARALSGRGLLLVDAVADHWGVEPTPGGKVVWAEVPLSNSF